ncbi:MAG TPA: tRNA (5-methylaminomethyl-2-thiouridine)(34)-methyltransferase MnmD, partial [Chitinophagales bacterium]|nr:tRNA (5-methylaminomethyl-2-thiouridine)(34)-methyltransferase MnmD [Chitinophagales bacterium]
MLRFETAMQIITTKDGSHTLFNDQFNEVYHSQHGAIGESLHVFIKQGLDYILEGANANEVNILEIGFGTGLNALLTMLEAEKRNLKIDYTTLELYPIEIATIKELNYTQQLGYEFCYGPYHSLHLVRWNEAHAVTPCFTFNKVHESVFAYDLPADKFDIIYFDAFAPDNQPEMWTADTFRNMYAAMRPGGVLVTYCSKSIVQRAMR